MSVKHLIVLLAFISITPPVAGSVFTDPIFCNSFESCDTEPDIFCGAECLLRWSFHDDPGCGWTWTPDPATQVDIIEAPNSVHPGEWKTVELLDDETRRFVRLDQTIPGFGDPPVRGRAPRLEVDFEINENQSGRDVFAVCIDAADCQITLAGIEDVFILAENDTGGIITGTVDLRPYLGQPDLRITLLFDTVEAVQAAPRDITLRITDVRLGSDVDDDGAFEGIDPLGRACDPCWDGDKDGYGDVLSPDPGTCDQTEADCDDTTALANPGIHSEQNCEDLLDNDCDGLTDALDVHDCGIPEDCANGVDDNADGAVDCQDQTCAGNAACSVCYTGFDFEVGDEVSQTSAGFVPFGQDDDGDIDLFEWGQTFSAFGGDGGWWTFFNDDLDRDGAPSGTLRGWLEKRAILVDTMMPEPALELVYDLDGAGITIGLCFDIGQAQGQPPSDCNSGNGGAVAWSTSAQTPVGTDRHNPINHTWNDGSYDRASVPIPRGTHDVAIFFEATGPFDVGGLFLNEVLVRSDVDLDFDGTEPFNGYENAAQECDRCIDRDGDGYGDPAFIISDLSTCPVPDVIDCNDFDDEIGACP
jgi:hypothetical protein